MLRCVALKIMAVTSSAKRLVNELKTVAIKSSKASLSRLLRIKSDVASLNLAKADVSSLIMESASLSDKRLP